MENSFLNILSLHLLHWCRGCTVITQYCLNERSVPIPPNRLAENCPPSHLTFRWKLRQLNGIHPSLLLITSVLFLLWNGPMPGGGCNLHVTVNFMWGKKSFCNACKLVVAPINHQRRTSSSSLYIIKHKSVRMLHESLPLWKPGIVGCGSCGWEICLKVCSCPHTALGESLIRQREWEHL